MKKESVGIWLWCATAIFFHLPLRSPGHFTIICEICCSSGRRVCTKCTSWSVYFMPRGEETAAAAEENKWERRKVMNGTVGKLAGDGPWTFVTPIGVVCVVRLDFGLLLLFCKKGGGFTRRLDASRASHVSCWVQCCLMGTETGHSPHTMQPIKCDTVPLPHAWAQQKQSYPGDYSLRGHGAVKLPNSSSGDREKEVVAYNALWLAWLLEKTTPNT